MTTTPLTTTEQTPQQRRAAAEQAMADARLRAEYHGWSGASGNAYVAAKRELRAADRAVWQARAQVEREADRDATEGRGAAAYAIIAGVVVAAIIAALLLINAAHGGVL